VIGAFAAYVIVALAFSKREPMQAIATE
jgi:hypothetical protein